MDLTSTTLLTGILLILLALPLVSRSLHNLVHTLTLGSRQQPPPHVLIILGGSRAREVAAARLTVASPTLREVRVVLLSSGEATVDALAAATAHDDAHDDASKNARLCTSSDGSAQQQGQVPTKHFLIDRSAVDTVTNFTSTAAALASNRIRHVAVATSCQHARRARLVGTIVYGAYGIHISFYSVVEEKQTASGGTSEPPAEGLARCLRDGLRAMAWALTGLDGRSLAALVHPRRAADSRSWVAGSECDASEQPSGDALLEVDRALSTLQRALLDCRERWPASAALCRWVIALCNTLGSASGNDGPATSGRSPLSERLADALGTWEGLEGGGQRDRTRAAAV